MPWIHSGLLALVFLSTGTAGSYAALHPAAYAGTYAIRLCQGSCRGAPYSSGTIVLFERPLRNARGHFFHAELDRQYVNGCFVRAKAPPGQDAGMYPQSFFSWALRDGAAELQLERSPDAGYEVRLELAPKGLSGTGMVWGAAVGPLAPGATPPPRDEVAAERLGDPDIKRCAPLPREDFL